MPIELKVPEIGESITEVEIGGWLKQAGDAVKKDEPLVTLESEKATVELPSPEAGTLSKQLKQKGDTAKVGEVIGYLESEVPAANEEKVTKPAKASAKPAEAKPESKAVEQQRSSSPPPSPPSDGREEAASAGQPSTAKTSAPPPKSSSPQPSPPSDGGEGDASSGPPASEKKPGGPRGGLNEPKEKPRSERLQEGPRAPAPGRKGLPPAEAKPPAAREDSSTEERTADQPVEQKRESSSPPPSPPSDGGEGGALPEPALRAERAEEVVPMSRLRRTVAERLVEAQRNAALLTTFNEIDMGEIVALRRQYGEAFQEKYHVKLGFMSFFVKACIDALKQFPALNARIRGTDIVYHNYFDIGVAIGSGKGLVVPVLRNAERMSFAEIETAIGDLARRAQENKLKPEELQGGTFTITNGGVYGSLLSTPIVNPPQSGVLGMHAIQDRPVAHEGTVIIRPMMYVALTYDHRIADGREAVLCLKRIKETIESPTRMVLEV